MIGVVASDNVGSDAIAEDMVTSLMQWAADAGLMLAIYVFIDRRLVPNGTAVEASNYHISNWLLP